MRYSERKKVGVLTSATNPIVICRLNEDIPEEEGFFKNVPTATTIITHKEFYGSIGVSFLWQRNPFKLEHYIVPSYSGDENKPTTKDCIDAIFGNPGWILAKVSVEGYDKINLHYYDLRKISPAKVEQLIITIERIPYLDLCIARTTREGNITEQYRIELNGQFSDAASALNVIKCINEGENVVSTDLARLHLTSVYTIGEYGKATGAKYVGLIGETVEMAKLYVLSIDYIV